jgi:5-carboxymethyl-2-hydroxymuconate isomerase
MIGLFINMLIIEDRMPHLTIEYSSNLPADDLRWACTALHQVLAADAAFERGAIRVRAVRCDIYAIADQHPENAFVAMMLRIGAGRSPADKQRIGRAVFTMSETVFSARLRQPHFALSLDIVENDPVVSWKANSMHARLRGSKGAP